MSGPEGLALPRSLLRWLETLKMALCPERCEICGMPILASGNRVVLRRSGGLEYTTCGRPSCIRELLIREWIDPDSMYPVSVKDSGIETVEPFTLHMTCKKEPKNGDSETDTVTDEPEGESDPQVAADERGGDPPE